MVKNELGKKHHAYFPVNANSRMNTGSVFKHKHSSAFRNFSLISQGIGADVIKCVTTVYSCNVHSAVHYVPIVSHSNKTITDM